MKKIFADTFYWVALINPEDDYHQEVLKLSYSLSEIIFVTTEEVLIEVLAFYSKSGYHLKQKTTTFINSILENSQIEVIKQTHESFTLGFKLYQQRLDKGYSLTDCISMNTMKQLKINEVLTHDVHFTQEGFIILFP
ncbi:type II toxin-antitoxin system VapC family toxin [Geminocystis sp. CENA526]|uniref:type II toxin-antitoxin system VapC family toxin n=1 Tax=Geminocystis sp. CENA526 TaxID=1355871 RepID=UPI003D6ECA93